MDEQNDQQEAERIAKDIEEATDEHHPPSEVAPQQTAVEQLTTKRRIITAKDVTVDQPVPAAPIDPSLRPNTPPPDHPFPPPGVTPQGKKPSNPFKLALIVLIALLALVALGLSYLLYMKNQTSKPSATTAALSPTPKPTIPAQITQATQSGQIDTSNWKTFSGRYFTFKFPSNWYVSPANQSVTISDTQIPFDVPAKTPPAGHQIIWVGFLQQDMPDCFPYTNGGNSCVNSTIKPYSINGYTGIRGQSTTPIGLSDIVYLKNPNGGYFSFQNEVQPADNFNEVLATFKITP